jgi:thiol-disulfide isomerase/thioredoxin
MKCKFACVLSMFVVLTLLRSASPAQSSSQSPLSLSGCEAAPEVSKAIREELDQKVLEKMTYNAREVRRREVFQELIAKYPRESQPYDEFTAYMTGLDWSADRTWVTAEQERLRKQAAQNPDDPLSLAVAGSALYRTDTAESLRLLEEARAKAPEFPWPAVQLAWFYSRGLHKDKQKSLENLTAYFHLCPASINERAQWLLAKNDNLQHSLLPTVAKALRESLAKETDPDRLENYEALWGLEFRSHPPQEHDALRKQVATDLKRIESMNSKPDAEWEAFLIRGYQQAEASTATVTAMEDHLLREFPHSNDAYDIVEDRWKKANKKPDDQKDAAAWTKYRETYKEAVKTWIVQFPDSRDLGRTAWFYAIYDDDSLSEKDGIAALDEYLQYETAYEAPLHWTKLTAGNFLLEHKWQLDRAVELLQQAKSMSDHEHAVEAKDDLFSASERKAREEEFLAEDMMTEGSLLKAAQLVGRPDAAVAIRSAVAGPVPEQEKLQSRYWWNRARLAALEGHNQDALAYYQLSLQTRSISPEWSRGKFRDDLTDEAQALWKEQGGTTEAWAIWSKPLSIKGTELAQGRWEKPKSTLPAFELTDLSGKVWRSQDLRGKSVFINVWATWCGPCNQELPSLQKLYEQLKTRSDVQVLTLNFDQDLGSVAPFMQDKGYTFPVIPALSLVNSVLDDDVAIPQNWIVDTKGTWLWTQIGYGDEGDWAQTMTQKLEAAKASN